MQQIDLCERYGTLKVSQITTFANHHPTETIDVKQNRIEFICGYWHTHYCINSKCAHLCRYSRMGK